jgi:prepilin-type processing-associated H-X9-DG protein
MGYYVASSWEWDFKKLANGTVVPGILWSGQTVLRVMQCPSYDRPSTTIKDPYTGYNYNTSYIGGGGKFNAAGIWTGEQTPLSHQPLMSVRIEMVHRPTEVALFGDGQYYGGTDKYMRAPVQMNGTNIGDTLIPVERAAGTQGFRHLGRTNVVYCDGHAESLSTAYTSVGANTAGTVTYTSNLVGAGTGFLSTDNSAYSDSP